MLVRGFPSSVLFVLFLSLFASFDDDASDSLFVAAEKKPVVPAETIASWHEHHKRFRERQMKNRQNAMMGRKERLEMKSGWVDEWGNADRGGGGGGGGGGGERASVPEEEKKEKRDAIENVLEKSEKLRRTTSKESNEWLTKEVELAKELFEKIPEKKKGEILRAMENFLEFDEKPREEEKERKKEEEKVSSSETTLNEEKEEVDEESEKVRKEEKRRTLESLEKERREKEKKLAVVEETDGKDGKDAFVPIDEDDLPKGTVAYGTYDTCDTCELCSVEEPPESVDVTKAEKAKEKASPSSSDGKIHCKRCFGCNVVLSRLESNQDLHGKKVKMFAGASGAAVVRGYTKEHGNVIIKSWCDFGGYKQHPETAAKHPLKCKEETESKNARCPLKGGIHAYGECNYRFLNALDKLTVDANLTGIVPRTWTGSVKSFLPWDGHAVQGHKIDVRSQFYEVAKGYSIEAVYGGSVAKDTVDMFKNIKHEEVIKAATFDLLFSEQDRHGQNVFINEEGDITLIDSEGCFGPTNSLLLPGGQKFEVYRIGYNAVCCGNTPLSCPQPAGDHSSPLVGMDYRCHADDHFIGFDWPEGVEPFLRKIQKMTEDDVHEVYEMTRKEHASHLKRSVDEMLELGFEGALLKAYQRQKRGDGLTYGNDYWYPITRACCGNDICPMRVDNVVGRLNIEKSAQGEFARKLWGSQYVHGLEVKNSPSESLRTLASLPVPKLEKGSEVLVDRLKQQQ